VRLIAGLAIAGAGTAVVAVATLGKRLAGRA
jgi:hypothetical protein